MTGEKPLSPSTQGEAGPQDHACRGQSPEVSEGGRQAARGNARRLPPSPRPRRADPPDTIRSPGHPVTRSPAHPEASAERRCHDGSLDLLSPTTTELQAERTGVPPTGGVAWVGEGRALDSEEAGSCGSKSGDLGGVAWAVPSHTDEV